MMCAEPAPSTELSMDHLLWSNDGKWVCELCGRWVNLWDTNSGHHVFQRVVQRNQVIKVASFHPTSGHLALAIAGRANGIVQLYSTDDWQENGTYSWPVGRIGVIAFHPNGTLAAVGRDKPEVVVWDVDW